MNKILLYILVYISIVLGATPKDITTQIEKEILLRDSYIQSYLPNTLSLNNYNSPGIIHTKLNLRTKWGAFFRGVQALQFQKDPSLWFEKALLRTTSTSQVFALFLEFERIKERAYAQKCLDALYEQMVRSGAVEIPEITRQLQLLARRSLTKGERETAAFYLEGALRFSSTNSKTLIAGTIAGLGKYSRSFTLLNATKGIIEEIKHNWLIQHHLISALIRFLITAISVTTLSLLILMTVKYFSRALHHIICKYPLSVPYKVRFAFVAMLFVPLLIFGGFPVLLLLAALITLAADNRKHKVIMLVVIAGLSALPINTFIRQKRMIVEAPTATTTLLKRATNEIITLELITTIKRTISSPTLQSTHEKGALNTALAIAHFKLDNQKEALYFIQQAQQHTPEDLSTLLATGVIYRHNDYNKEAHHHFKKATELFPYEPEPLYNLSRIALELHEVEYTGNNLKKATELDNEFITSYLQENQQYFGATNWPHTRRYLFSRINSRYFNNTKKRLLSPDQNANITLWGERFFSLSPTHSIIIVLVVFITLLLRFISTVSRRSSIGKCSLCGKPTCKACRKSEYCNECDAIIREISNESLVEQMKIKISLTKRLTSRIIGISINALYPGSAAFFINSKPKLNAFPLLIISVLVITLHIYIAQSALSLFAEQALLIKMIVHTALLFYHVVFFIKFFRSLKHEQKAGKA